MTETMTTALSPEQHAAFQRLGYLILRQLAPADVLVELQQVAREQLAERRAPLEYESEADYPGLPGLTGQTEGTTVRRLLQAYDRHPAFASWASHERLTDRIRSLLGNDLWLVRNHHNCLMTKHPAGSSRTGWHRDTRYWYFTRPELINAWLALDGEHPVNGGLHVIPGSHDMEIEADRLDEALFLRNDPRNEELIIQAEPLNLNPGDVLLFHSHLMHAAGDNQTDAVKHALVFTYRSGDNPPLPDSRSSRLSDIKLKG